MTHEEANRKIAEALGWDVIPYELCENDAQKRGAGIGRPCGTATTQYIPDFYDSEEANALVLNEGCSRFGPMTFWEKAYLRMPLTSNAVDFGQVKRAAICAAFLAMLEKK